MMVSFSQTDAWILWSVATDAAGSTLPDIIAKADFVNHAIPSREEVETALTKGLQVGLLHIDGRHVRLAPEHAEEVRKTVEKPRHAFDSWTALHRFLIGREWPRVCSASVWIGDESMETAYAEYRGMFKKPKARAKRPKGASGEASPFELRQAPRISPD
jgi:hypothetical protein